MRHIAKYVCILVLLILVVSSILLALQSLFLRNIANASSKTSQAAVQIYLPFVIRSQLNAGPTPSPSLSATPLPSPTSVLRRVNAPHFAGNIDYSSTAIFWFGHVNQTSNYADVRVGYNDTELHLSMNIFDRRLWYNPNPSTSPLTVWDATTLYLDLGGNSGTGPTANAYRFDGQLNDWQTPRTPWQASYRGNGSRWSIANIAFTTQTSYRWESSTVGGLNNNQNNRGWEIDYTIPFASLGLPGPPSQGTKWGMALEVHDRDDATGTPIPDETWPENLSGDVPLTWGQLAFGLTTYAPPQATPRATVTMRQGLNGETVPDAAVGGTIGNLCGGDPTYDWNQWGNANFAGAEQFNIQNQGDLADWPCFAKYYVTFPLDSLPQSKAIISATLTLHQFGNAGDPGQAQPSLIQVLTITEDWNEATLTWNNAPLAVDNVSRAWVDPLPSYPGDAGVARSWDVSGAVAAAYAHGSPLRLVLYEADSAYHSGKYFISSNTGDWNAVARPQLDVLWGDP